jgi:hypothetical protein
MANNDVQKLPWEVQPALEERALSQLGEMLLQTRRDVSAHQQPERGDGKYGLGCSTYERFTYQISALVGKEGYSWLGVKHSGNEFAVSLNGCPLRIYRGDSEKPPTKQLERAKEQLSLFPNLKLDDPDWLWFLVVETDARGLGIQAVVMQANTAGDTRYRWIVARATPLAPGESGAPTAPIGPAPDSPTPISSRVTDVSEPIVKPLDDHESEKNKSTR